MVRFCALALLWTGCKPGEARVDTGLDSTTVVIDTGTVPSSDCDIDLPNNTVGLRLCTDRAQPGYTLFAPTGSTITYLIDIEGQVVHTWTSEYNPGEAVYLEENGHLLRTAKDPSGTPFGGGGTGGRVQEFDWDGNLVWDFRYASPTYLHHHDVERLPSGNVLLIVWQLKSQEEALAWGRDPISVDASGVWADSLIEVDPSTDEVVWQWHVWDHVVQDFDASKPNYGVVADQIGRIDLNEAIVGPNGALPDWNHVNSVDYNAELDQIAISVKHQNEVWIIDHNTTTEQARGPAGDLRYRWGSDANFGVDVDRRLSGQHDVEWIDAGLDGVGQLLVFNNGLAWGASSIVQLDTQVQPDGSYALTEGRYSPEAPSWRYADANDGFFSLFVGGSQRLPNGNTLICEGEKGRLFEVTSDGDTVWQYENPVNRDGPAAQGDEIQGNFVFRADRYPPSYPAFDGVDLSPQGTVER